MKTTTAWNTDHIALLDGLRGLALLMVLAYHFTPLAHIGWAGVDLFLVLSGFLITWKLVQDEGRPNYFRNFYLRRILRIVPLYVVALLVLFVLGPWLIPALVTRSYAGLMQLMPWYWTFTQNIYFGLHGWSDNITVLHYWSLALEMQFYLLWPFVVILFVKRTRVFIAVLAGLILFAILFRAYAGDLFTLHPLYHYVLLPSRIDAFAAGALVYMLLHVYGQQCRQMLKLTCLCSLVIILTAYLFFADVDYMGSFSAIIGHTLFDVCWATMMGYMMLLPKGGWSKALFSNAFMVSMGKYSYGMYVVHLPVGVVLAIGVRWMQQHHYGFTGITYLEPLVAFGVTWLLGIITYHGLEKHFLRIKPR